MQSTCARRGLVEQDEASRGSVNGDGITLFQHETRAVSPFGGPLAMAAAGLQLVALHEVAHDRTHGRGQTGPVALLVALRARRAFDGFVGSSRRAAWALLLSMSRASARF